MDSCRFRKMNFIKMMTKRIKLTYIASESEAHLIQPLNTYSIVDIFGHLPLTSCLHRSVEPYDITVVWNITVVQYSTS